MITEIKKGIAYLLVLISFISVSLAYFSPVLQGKKIVQSDIVQYIGMAKQQIDIRKNLGEEAYWNDSAFAGMPTYQLGAKYPHNYIKKIDSLIRFLPRPVDYLFLYFISFFVLLSCLKVKPLLAFFGSLAFGFSTYLIVIIGVGHNAKAHAIGYMPLVLSGVLLVYAKKYAKGGLLFCLALALELVSNHFQMTYYLMMLIAVVSIVYLLDSIKNNTLNSFFKSSIVLVCGVFLSVALNATSILATQEYAKFSTRSQSEISITPSGAVKEKKGLDKDYILSYSYGLLESFNLFIPRFMGGASFENASKNSEVTKELVKMGYPVSQARNPAAFGISTYWGNQPIVGGPPYIGAGIIFLVVLGLFFLEGKKKVWVVSASILALLLSWGKNLEFLSDFFINYIPFYNKFRAVTSIQVIMELCFPFFAIWTVHKFLTSKNETHKQKSLLKATIATGGLLLIFLLFKNILFSFSNQADAELIKAAGINLVDALREDRISIFTTDVLRSLFYVLAISAVLFAYLKQKISTNIGIIIIGFLLVFDLVTVDWRYVNSDNFASSKRMDVPFTETQADKEILKDKSHYRVFDLNNSFNSARASYFHNSVGGYHGAKPARIQDLYDFYISKGKQSILDMLNVKYFLFENEKGIQFEKNVKALGNAWFIEKLNTVTSANDEILELGNLDISRQAIIREGDGIKEATFKLDSLASISLQSHKHNHLVYKSVNDDKGYAVFSEMYYKKGWKAYVDGVETPIYKTNYALRGINIPKGIHKIDFKFDPKIIKIGGLISLTAFIFFITLILFFISFNFKNIKFIKQGNY